MNSVDYLLEAFLLSKKANSKDIRPNPFVGAIIVDENDQIIGRGFHQKYGEAHAEVMAINDALTQKTDLSSCTLYVTLEPCSHYGKTPPCTQLILKNKIPKVVIGSMDPNPLVSGAEILQKEGVIVEKHQVQEIIEWNKTFRINQQLKRPQYILKTATTANGKIADRQGNSQWISNEKSRQYVHQHIRTNADAILTTAHTILKDNATMNIRVSGAAAKELNLVVIDRDLSLLEPSHQKLGIFYKRTNTRIYIISDKMPDKQVRGDVEIISTSFQDGRIQFNELNEILLQKRLCQILVEAGATLNTAMIEQQLIDEFNVFICPSLLLDCQSINVFNSTQFHNLNNSTKLRLKETMHFDQDVLLKYEVVYSA